MTLLSSSANWLASAEATTQSSSSGPTTRAGAGATRADLEGLLADHRLALARQNVQPLLLRPAGSSAGSASSRI